jgi:RNA polymerase sigma-70 factor (ECF subfamily)
MMESVLVPWQLIAVALPAVCGESEVPDAVGTRASTFEEVYDTYFDFVWRNLRRLGVDESSVDDAAHDVFIVVYRQFSGFDGRNYKGWLFAISQRVAWHYRRSAARRRLKQVNDAEDCPAHGSGPDSSHERKEALAIVHHLLLQLSEDRRAVFVLSELEQMSVPEIARMLGLPLNTAYSRLRLARRDFGVRLRNYLRIPNQPRSAP